MRFDVMTGGLGLVQMQSLATDARDLGYTGLVVTEAGRTAYLACAAAALATDIDLLTGVAVAFPRSPMVTATVAWELAEASGGRFRLGLGAQVRAHVERRYSAEFDPPGPRLREYVGALRAIFAAFRGEAPLEFEGDYYQFSLLPRTWSPGPIDVPDPPIDVAAVNPWMLRMAATCADGVHVHPLNTRTYLRDTALPTVRSAATEAGRDPDDIEIIVPAFLVVGDDEEERAARREMARFQIAFYGSTPNYAFIFEQIGFDGVTERLRERQKAGDVAGMALVITDDILEHFIVEDTWAGLGDAIVDRFGGAATRVVDYFAAMTWPTSGFDPRWADVAATVTSAEV